MNPFQFVDLGLKDYKETWDLQLKIQKNLISDKTSGTATGQVPTLFFVEHPHVYTLGKSGQVNNMLVNPGFISSIGATFYRTDRGGDITYHGPGQIVGYPVFDLDVLHIGVKKYIENIESAIINTLREFGINTCRLNGATGVWIQSPSSLPTRKICAIGVKVSRGITMHGFALNVATDLKYFSYINPCGFTDKTVTSMKNELGIDPGISKVKQALLHEITNLFHAERSAS
jgi:lipoyl(octanoyl) transferase